MKKKTIEKIDLEKLSEFAKTMYSNPADQALFLIGSLTSAVNELVDELNRREK